MAYISLNLSPNDPQPGSYTLTIQDCNDSTDVVVATNLTNPDDFPYIFNTDDYITYGDCFNYTITDVLSGCQSTGTLNNGDEVTPQPTSTTTATPPADTDTIKIGVSMSSGSTILDFTLTATKEVSTDTNVDFNFTIYRKDGTQKTLFINGLIRSGNSSVTVREQLPDDFSNIDLSRYTIKNETTDNPEFTVTRYDSSSKTVENERSSNIIYDFVGCCDSSDIQPFLVDSRSVVKGSWAEAGGRQVVLYNGKCYSSLRASKSTRYVATFFGPDYTDCRNSNCINCTDPTPTPTPSTEVPVLDRNYTSVMLVEADAQTSDGSIRVNLKNTDLAKKSFYYGGNCYTIDKDHGYTLGVNYGRDPLLSTSSTYISLNACKASNNLQLKPVFERVTEEYAELNYKKPLKTSRKQTFTLNPKQLGNQLSSLVTVNAFAPCGSNITNPDIFVWYDSSGSYRDTELRDAVSAVRQWYVSLRVEGLGGENVGSNQVQGAFSGNLYEHFLGEPESPLNALTYPTLRSLSGGTITNSDGTTETIIYDWQPIAGENEAGQWWQSPWKFSLIRGESHSELEDSYTDSSGVTHSFDQYGSTHPSAYDLADANGEISNDSIVDAFTTTVNGVPGTNLSANISQSTLDTIFEGQSVQDGQYFYDAITIIISNEFDAASASDSGGGFIDYDGQGGPCDQYAYSNVCNIEIWKNAYDNYLKVWNHKTNLGYPTLNYLFAFPRWTKQNGLDNSRRSAGYLFGMLALSEGQNFTTEIGNSYNSTYTNEFGETVTVTWPNINEYLLNNDPSGDNTNNCSGPHSYDFSLLEQYGNMFNFLDYPGGQYQLLDPQYQNGIGLKNFGLTVDPNISTFNPAVLRTRLADYINDALLNALTLYTLVECGPNNYDCFDPGYSVMIGDSESCLEVVLNTLIDDNYFGTGTFEIDDDYYNINTGYTSSDFITFQNCEDCLCDDDLISNFRESLTIVNTSGSDITITIYGNYGVDGVNTTTDTFTILNGATETINGYDLDPDACINIEQTLSNNTFPVGVQISVGDCCDPTDPVAPSPTPTSTNTPTPTMTQTQTQTPTMTQTQTQTPTSTPTPPPSMSQTPTQTPTMTQTQTQTQTPTQTQTQTQTPTPSVSMDATPPPTPTPTQTPTPSSFDCGQLTLNIGNTQPSGDDCYTDDIVMVVSVSPAGLEPVDGPITLLGISGNTSGDPVVLVDGVDYTINQVNNNQINVTLPWQTYQNLEYTSLHICVETATGCEICEDYVVTHCDCPKYHIFCDCTQTTYGSILQYQGETIEYAGYNIPRICTSVCDLLPLADVTTGSDGSLIYTVSTTAQVTAFSAHMAWDGSPDVDGSYFDFNNDGQITSSDLLLLESILSPIVLNDYLECYESNSPCFYIPYDGIDYVEGQFYYIETLAGYEACYRYDGIFNDCEDTLTHWLSVSSITNTPYDLCEDCLNTHLPTPTQTQTPTVTPTPTSPLCEINLTTLGTKYIGGQNGTPFEVNVVSHYFQPKHGITSLYAYSEQDGLYDEIIPFYNDIQQEASFTPNTTVQPSLCTFYKASDLWATTINGSFSNVWDDIYVNRITQPIYIDCNNDCTSSNKSLLDINGDAITWGDFRDNYLAGNNPAGGYVVDPNLVVYDRNSDIVYRITTENVLNDVNLGQVGTTENISDDDLMIVDIISNCESEDDIFVTDDGNGWSFNGVTGNPTLTFEKGRTYRFHVVSQTKDFWIGSNNENTISYDVNDGEPCVSSLYTETINPNSLLLNCIDDVSYCSGTNSMSLSECSQILHEKTFSLSGFSNYHKTIVFRPKCNHDCDVQLFYYDRLSAWSTDQDVDGSPHPDCNDHMGYIKIADNTDCTTGVVVTHSGIMSTETGLIHDVVVQWVDCEGNPHTHTIVHPGPSTPNSPVLPYDYIIPGCVQTSSVTVLPTYIEITQEGRFEQSGRCWCGNTIRKGENCFESCGSTKPNFGRPEIKTPTYVEVSGVKGMTDQQIQDVTVSAPFVFGKITDQGVCCSNCDESGLEIGLNYNLWLAQNCCDVNDVIVVKVYPGLDPAGYGFNLMSRTEVYEGTGNPVVTCYTFTHEVLSGCDIRTVYDIAIGQQDYIFDPCRTAVSDYDVAIANNLCVECPEEIVEQPCKLPYGEITGVTTGYHELIFDYGSQTGTIEMTFDALNSSNRIKVYQIFNGTNQESLKADSLWVGNRLTGYVQPTSSDEFQDYTEELASLVTNKGLNLPQYNFVLDCESSWDYTTNSPSLPDVIWEPTGTIQTSTVTTDDIPVGFQGQIIYRSTGAPGQVNVVNNYPSPQSLACDGKVKLRFTKGSSVNNLFKVKVWSHSDDSESNDPWTLDVKCIDPCGTEVEHLWSPENPCEFGSVNCRGYRLTTTGNATYSYIECPSLVNKTINVSSSNNEEICAVHGSVTLTSGSGNATLQSGICEVGFVPLSNIFESTNSSETTYADSSTSVKKVLYDSMVYDPLNQFNLSGDYFEAQASGTYTLDYAQFASVLTQSEFSGGNSVWLSWSIDENFNNRFKSLKVQVGLYDYNTNELLQTGGIHRIDMVSVINPSTAAIAPTLMAGQIDVNLTQGQKVYLGIRKCCSSPNSYPGNSYYLQNPNERYIQNDISDIHLWRGGTLTLHAFAHELTQTTLFIDSDTPNLPQPCDQAFLDPCCLIPAEGHLVVVLPNGDLSEFIVDENGFLSDCPCCDTAFVDSNCDNIGTIQLNVSNLFVPNAFTPNGDGVNDVWGPVFAEPDCVTWTMKLFPSGCIALDGINYQVHEFTNNDPLWDGTLIFNDNGIINGPYPCVFAWLLTWQAADGQTGTETGHVTCVV